jgi:hypothetical protein
MDCFIYWSGHKIPFVPGEMLAFTLLRARKNLAGIGSSPTGQRYGLFCGIGACQGCLVKIAGRGIAEACLTPSENGMRVGPVYLPENGDQPSKGQHSE